KHPDGLIKEQRTGIDTYDAVCYIIHNAMRHNTNSDFFRTVGGAKVAKNNGKTPEVIEVVENGRSKLTDNAHKVLLVGLGAVAMGQDRVVDVQEELEHFFNKLIERGEAVEKDGRKRITQTIERRKKQTEEITNKAESGIEKRIEEVLHRMN